MKSFLLFSFSFLMFAQFTWAQSGAKITFKEEKHNFGELEEGPKVTHEFTFTNTGTEPLILSNVKASCGCTTPSWPKDPVMPGATGSIMVTYNTANRPGSFNKSVTITSNATEATKLIYISGNVKAAPLEETLPVKQPLMMAPSN